MNRRQVNEILTVITAVLTVVILGSMYWSFQHHSEGLLALDQKISDLRVDLDQTVAIIQGDLVNIETGLSEALQEEQQTVAMIQQQLGGFENTVGSISGSVSTLEKLSRTDPQLLQKYSKVFFLNEHYHPPRLVEIPNQYKYNEERTVRFHAQAWPYLERLLQAAEKDGVKLFVASGFRSFNEQSVLKSNYVITYGAGTANQFSADQGYSEHQLGTAADFLTTGIGGTLSGFETTPAYSWLLNNAHRFGFVLSYPENNSYYIFEPWHWRFVGVKLATDLHRAGDYFYDWDQRDIDEYLIHLFD